MENNGGILIKSSKLFLVLSEQNKKLVTRGDTIEKSGEKVSKLKSPKLQL